MGQYPLNIREILKGLPSGSENKTKKILAKFPTPAALFQAGQAGLEAEFPGWEKPFLAAVIPAVMTAMTTSATAPTPSPTPQHVTVQPAPTPSSGSDAFFGRLAGRIAPVDITQALEDLAARPTDLSAIAWVLHFERQLQKGGEPLRLISVTSSGGLDINESKTALTKLLRRGGVPERDSRGELFFSLQEWLEGSFVGCPITGMAIVDGGPAGHSEISYEAFGLESDEMPPADAQQVFLLRLIAFAAEIGFLSSNNIADASEKLNQLAEKINGKNINQPRDAAKFIKGTPWYSVLTRYERDGRGPGRIINRAITRWIAEPSNILSNLPNVTAGQGGIGAALGIGGAPMTTPQARPTSNGGGRDFTRPEEKKQQWEDPTYWRGQ